MSPRKPIQQVLDDIESPPSDTLILIPQLFQDEEIGVWSCPIDIEETNVEDLVETEPNPPFIVTAYRNSSLRATHITYGPIPYFPDTHPDGHMYVHSLQDERRTPKDIFDDVQFCHKRKWGPKPTKSIFLDGVDCIRERHTCSGIVACEYLHPRIREMKVQQVTANIWMELKQYGVEDWDITSKKRAALSWFLGNRNMFLKGTSCSQFQPGSCKFLFLKRDTVTYSGISQWYIRCINQIGSSGRDHFFQPLDPKYIEYTSFLQERVLQDQYPNKIKSEYCSFIGPTTVRSPKCGIDHIQGQGKVKALKVDGIHTCKVLFDMITPKDLSRTPYIIWQSTGIHDHPPPTIEKVPRAVRQDLIRLFIRINNPSLTTNKAIVSSEVKSWLIEQGVTTFGQLHPALHNHDRIALCILQYKMFRYPYGSSIGGVEYEYWHKHKYNQNRYIQKFYFDGQNLAVFCFYREQAILLSQQTSFEVDMAFKRVRDHSITEIVFAKFMPNIKQAVTLSRIFVNSETSQTYRFIFTEYHNLLRDECGIILKWRHLDNSAQLYAIVADQDPKQMAGFGSYLHILDPLKRDWQFHVQSSTIFCKVHYQRGVEKLIGKPNQNQYQWNILMDIPNCRSKKEYMFMCDLIIGNNDWSTRVQDWVKYLKQETIAAGLNKFCSKMNRADFESTRNNSNTVEVEHARGNSVGRRCTFIQAIQNSEALDLDQIEQYHAIIDYSISSRYRTKAMSDRHEIITKRNYNKRTKEIQERQGISQQYPNIEEDLYIPEVLQGTSSSGMAKKKRVSKPKQQDFSESQLQTSSKPQKKRLRSLTVESSHDFMQRERDNTVNTLQQELSVRTSLFELRQKGRKLDQLEEKEEAQVQVQEKENQSRNSFKSVWDGLRAWI